MEYYDPMEMKCPWCRRPSRPGFGGPPGPPLRPGFGPPPPSTTTSGLTAPVREVRLVRRRVQVSARRHLPRRPARAQVVQTGPAPARAASVPLRRRKSGRLRHPSSRLHLSPRTPSSRKMSPPRHLPATTRTTMRPSGIWSG